MCREVCVNGEWVDNPKELHWKLSKHLDAVLLIKDVNYPDYDENESPCLCCLDLEQTLDGLALVNEDKIIQWKVEDYGNIIVTVGV